ncbi:MAG: hypothetical protein RIS29_3102 [Bacteroidota bacterium]|jgi:hypothetical protein
MENQTEIIIPISTEKDRFSQHLQTENNQRIIFSGLFGSGKTYFLDEFFKEHNEYEAFFLSPVHYSVSRNEDVFEYIKYDILISLFAKETVEWKETHFSNELLLSFFVEENFIQIAKDTIKHAGKVGKIVSEVIEDIGKYQKKFEAFKARSETDQPKEAKTYIDDFRKQIGSIFEYDDNTTLINELLGTIPKEKVLIIDDLDRMDPDHIFRIMNVFAAQFDHERFGYNKFAFDKVIIVCDLDNLRNLFAHKYGSNVDFSGYIDKFYSIEPFMFDNKKAVRDKTGAYISSINNDIDRSYFLETKPLIVLLVHYNIITLRKLVCKKEGNWTYSRNQRNTQYNFYPEKTLIFIDFLLYLYGYMTEDLCNELDKLNDELDYTLYESSSLQFICPLLNLRDKYLTDDEMILIPKMNIQIKLKRSFGNLFKIESIKTSEEIEITKVPFFKLLSLCVKNYSTIQKQYQ